MPLGLTGWKPLFYSLLPTALHRIEANASGVWRFHHCWDSNHAFTICGTTFKDIVIQMQSDAEYSSTSEHATHQGNILRALGSALQDRRLSTTDRGYLCHCPPYIRRGDIVAILFGCQVPVLLRKHGDSYDFIGTCYVHGIMQGEAIAGIGTGQYVVQNFDIR